VLQHVVDAACRSRLDPVIVVLGFEAERVRGALETAATKLVLVVNEDYEHGQSTSLRRGLRAVPEECEAAAVLLGDEPGVGTGRIDQVLDAFSRADRRTTPIVRPTYLGPGNDRVPGHPVVLDRSVWSRLQRECGDRGARALMSEEPALVLNVAWNVAAPVDIDTDADWRRLCDEKARGQQ